MQLATRIFDFLSYLGVISIFVAQGQEYGRVFSLSLLQKIGLRENEDLIQKSESLIARV